MEVRDKRKDNWFWIDNIILERYGAEIGPYGIALYCALCKYASNETQTSYPSQASLGKLLGMTPPTVRAALKKLVECGLVEYEHRASDTGARTSNMYYLVDVRGQETSLPTPTKADCVPQETSFPRTRLTEQDLIEQPPKADACGLSRREQLDAVNLVMNYFTELTGLKPIGSETQVRWRAPAKEILEMVEWDIGAANRLVLASYQKMRGDHLTYNSIQSIVRMAAFIHSQEVAPARSGMKAW